MFSVIIPLYNKLPHIDRSISSVLNQTFQEFEIIIINDASTDGSFEKILEYTDPRIRIFSRDVPGPGGYAARNLGIKNAKYKRIAFLDADDEWSLTYLEEVYNLILLYPKSEIISSKWSYSMNNILKEPLGFKNFRNMFHEFTLEHFFKFNLIVWTSAVIVNKELLLNCGLFPEGKCQSGGDMDTWIRSLYLSKLNIFLNKPLAIYYRDSVNRVTDNRKPNRTYKMCSLDTIKMIYASGPVDKKLSAAIDDFCAKHFLSILIRNFKAKNSTNLNDLNIIKSPRKKFMVLMKFYLFKFLYYLKLK